MYFCSAEFSPGLHNERALQGAHYARLTDRRESEWKGNLLWTVATYIDLPQPELLKQV